MHRDFAPAQKPPVCPACGRDMKFARLAIEQGEQVGLNIFECEPCRVSYATAAEDSEVNVKKFRP
jgi:ribosomal protein L37AE/L43A